jgi:hypothetical protein
MFLHIISLLTLSISGSDGRWFSPGAPVSSTTKNGHHDIAEILMKVALKHQISNQNEMYTEFVLESFFSDKARFRFGRDPTPHW